MCSLYQCILELYNLFFDFTGSHSNEFVLILKRNFGLFSNVEMSKTIGFLKMGLKAICIGDGHEAFFRGRKRPLQSESEMSPKG